MSVAFQALTMISCEHRCRGIKRSITEHVNEEVMHSESTVKQLQTWDCSHHCIAWTQHSNQPDWLSQLFRGGQVITFALTKRLKVRKFCFEVISSTFPMTNADICCLLLWSGYILATNHSALNICPDQMACCTIKTNFYHDDKANLRQNKCRGWKKKLVSFSLVLPVHHKQTPGAVQILH